MATEYIVDFTGNKTFSKEYLYKELDIDIPWWKKILNPKAKPKVQDKLLPILMQELELFYKSQGFLDVNISLSINKNIALFKIEENRPIIIEKISVTADFPINLTLKEGQRFIVKEFKASKTKTKVALLNRGYCSFDFRAKAYIYKKKKKAYLDYYLNKQDICKIKDIKISGLESVPKRVVLSHIYLPKDSNFSLQKLNYSYQRLYSLGYFRFVNIDYSKKIKNNILLDIRLKERQKTNIYKAGIGYDNQNFFHLNFYYKNLNYRLFQPSIRIYYSHYNKSGDFSLFYPSIKLFNIYTDTVFSLIYEYKDFKDFIQQKEGLSYKLLKEYFDLSFSMKLNFEKISIKDSTLACIKTKEYNLLYPEFFMLYDKRDSKLSPNRGYFLKEQILISFKSHSESKFIKNISTVGFLYPYKRFSIFTKAAFGTIVAADNLPANILFYAGGAKSNRAYGYEEIKALDSKCKVGGKTLLDTTLEGRFKYSDNIKFALFWDRTYLSKDEFKIDRYVDGTGVGSIINTPVGELKIYFGFNPKKFSTNAINIYLGASF